MIETKYDKIGDVAVVTMANPPGNTFTMELSAGLEGAVRRAVSEGARALVLQADGPLFCGGADVHIFAGTTARQARQMFAEGFQLVDALEDAPFLVIAAVHGVCFAAGLELALACDLIIAAEGAKFAQVEAKIGAATFLGGVYRLAERCGPARAKEIVFGAETYDAATFERWNIVNRGGARPGHARRGPGLGPAAGQGPDPRARGNQATGPVRSRLRLPASGQVYPRCGVSLARKPRHAVRSRPAADPGRARKFSQNHAEVVFEDR